MTSLFYHCPYSPSEAILIARLLPNQSAYRGSALELPAYSFNVLGLGKRPASTGGIHHAGPVGNANDETHLTHLVLRLAFLDVSPAYALFSGWRSARPGVVQVVPLQLQEVLYRRRTAWRFADTIQAGCSQRSEYRKEIRSHWKIRREETEGNCLEIEIEIM